MANNIYIGMRYVPIYVGDYNSETVYEPLSIVAYNGASYTSKQSVPAGILPTNTTYWAKSSDFNAQYSELDDRITEAQDTADDAATAAASAGTAASAAQTAAEAAQDTADDAQAFAESVDEKYDYYGKKFMLIGDSYANRDNSWEERFKSALGLTEGDDCYSSRVSGTGFTVATEALKWINIVTAMASNMSSDVKNSITDIIVAGGANDRSADASTIESAIAAFYSYVRTTFPNAKIYLAMIGWSTLATEQANMYKAYRSYARACNGSYMIYLEGTQYAMHDLSFFEDNYHPNTDGRNAIAQAIISSWKNGVISANSIHNVRVYPSTAYDNSDFDMSSNTSRLWSYTDGDNSYLKCERLGISKKDGMTYTSGTWYELADLSGVGFILGSGSGGRAYSWPAIIKTTASGAYFVVAAELRVVNSVLSVRFLNVGNQLTDIHTLYLGGFCLSFFSMNQNY